MTDFETWMLDDGYDRIFRFLRYRLPGQFTPEEIDKKYSDQSLIYLDINYEFMKIETAIELPDGDILLEYRLCYKDEFEWNISDTLDYIKLSQIELSYYPKEQVLGE